MVRHRNLDPTFKGSNPFSPAIVTKKMAFSWYPLYVRASYPFSYLFIPSCMYPVSLTLYVSLPVSLVCKSFLSLPLSLYPSLVCIPTLYLFSRIKRIQAKDKSTVSLQENTKQLTIYARDNLEIFSYFFVSFI